MILSVVLAEIVVSEVAVRPDRLIVIDMIARVAMTVTDVIVRAARIATDVTVRLVRLVMVIVSVVRLVRLAMAIVSVVRRDRLIVIDVIARVAMIETAPRTHAQMRSEDQTM
ncbi:MAG: hypothetical protein ACKO82_02545 [Acidimicrobiaceae bacterium]